MNGFWTDAAVRRALGLGGSAPRTYSAVSTDTRTLSDDALFVALRGERFDAHEFLAEAAARGARGAVVERVPADAPDSLVYYEVADTLEALGHLARHYRRALGARVCAVAGSNGKTTTKELTRAVLATRYRVHATEANYNNLVGVPLTLLAAPADAEALVVEVGTNSPGEIGRLARIVEPDAAIITSIAEEHLEGLGDLEGVLREETAILDGLPPDGVAVVADEPPELAERARALAPRVRVGGWSERADAELRAERVELDEQGRTGFHWQDRTVRLAFRGRPNARNALL
ncbi:MAG TPA: UDP-N-acetylmuramoyl-tripeptide--D-alanyl-D-alanine ligase, partial [Longimicrobiales bacterium]